MNGGGAQWASWQNRRLPRSDRRGASIKLKIVPDGWLLIALVAGVAITLPADRAFGRADTTTDPSESSSTLITDGVYRFTRNPMYLGFVLVLIGVVVLLRSLTPWAVVAAYVVLLDRAFVRVEEQMLARDFGEQWQAYVPRTQRWL